MPIKNYLCGIYDEEIIGEKRLNHDHVGAPHGTALQELPDVPIMNAYSNRECTHLFAAFCEINISNYQPGFARMLDFIPGLKIFENILHWIDVKSQQNWFFFR